MSTNAAALFPPPVPETFAEDRINDLFFAVEDLLKRIADTDDPNIRRKRAELREELIALQHDLPKLTPYLNHPAPPETPEGDEAEHWGQPALAALTGVALALRVLQRH